MIRKRINEWELEKGIKLKRLKNLIGARRASFKYTEKQFNKFIRRVEVICKTEKGLKFLYS